MLNSLYTCPNHACVIPTFLRAWESKATQFDDSSEKGFPLQISREWHGGHFRSWRYWLVVCIVWILPAFNKSVQRFSWHAILWLIIDKQALEFIQTIDYIFIKWIKFISIHLQYNLCMLKQTKSEISEIIYFLSIFSLWCCKCLCNDTVSILINYPKRLINSTCIFLLERSYSFLTRIQTNRKAPKSLIVQGLLIPSTH